MAEDNAMFDARQGHGDAKIIGRMHGDRHQGNSRAGAQPTEALRLILGHMKLRRSGVRVEDERGNPVSFFELKEMAEREKAGRKCG
jgi:hypothetical protein